MSFKSMIAQSKDKSFTYPTSQLFISLLHHVKKTLKPVCSTLARKQQLNCDDNDELYRNRRILKSTFLKSDFRP
jgi:hypothetical protein